MVQMQLVTALVILYQVEIGLDRFQQLPTLSPGQAQMLLLKPQFHCQQLVVLQRPLISLQTVFW